MGKTADVPRKKNVPIFIKPIDLMSNIKISKKRILPFDCFEYGIESAQVD